MKTTFKAIYEAALLGDEEQIKQYQYIDERKVGGIETAAEQLAKEGRFDAVKLLQKLGANVNYIARGAACGGHREYAEDLRLNYGASVNYIARGAGAIVKSGV